MKAAPQPSLFQRMGKPCLAGCLTVGVHPRRQGKAGTAVGRNAGGQSGTLAPAASLVLLRGRERMGRTDWEEA